MKVSKQKVKLIQDACASGTIKNPKHLLDLCEDHLILVGFLEEIIEGFYSGIRDTTLESYEYLTDDAKKAIDQAQKYLT